ncbi:hypothetical protein T484DRAFT_1839691 [Baffinella frigidus]|nr:hypothetical protein T484DRAFT_1839691 [Cryptophyta sp. CCMP2293]
MPELISMATYRGHLDRSRLRQSLAEEYAAVQIKRATYRGHLDRSRLRQSLAEEYAAVQIQRVYKGHVGRLVMDHVATLVTQWRAALKLQRVTRGHFVRRGLAQSRIRLRAAQLQRVTRGHFVPRGLAQSRVRLGAAQVLSRVYRGLNPRPRGGVLKARALLPAWY